MLNDVDNDWVLCVICRWGVEGVRVVIAVVVVAMVAVVVMVMVMAVEVPVKKRSLFLFDNENENEATPPSLKPQLTYAYKKYKKDSS